MIGEKLVKIARETLEEYFEKKIFKIKKFEEKELKQKRGVFVTLETFPEKNLRGCIGYPYPILPLGEAVQRAAYSAAFEDYRFPPLRKEELEKITIEVSVLSEPKLIEVNNPKEYLEKIEIGKDGLIIKNGPYEGLLLPQVATEFNWDVKEFLENLCMKAGLTPDYWLDKNTRIWKFQAEIFAEETPKGKIIKRS